MRGQLEKLLWKLPIPSGAKALGFIGGFDVRAEARTLQLMAAGYEGASWRGALEASHSLRG